MDSFRKFSYTRLSEQSEALGLQIRQDTWKPERLVFGKTGHATLALHGTYLHSRHDPVREAERQLASLEPEDSDALVLFFGAGLGYALALFLETRKNPVLWIEPEAEVLFFALGLADLMSAITEGRLRLLVSPDETMLRIPRRQEKSEVRRVFFLERRTEATGPSSQTFSISEETFSELARGYGNESIVFFGHPASYRISGAYADLQRQIENYLNKKSVNLATLARFDRIWMRNLIRNFPILIRARPVRSLFGTLNQKEAVVCGAGPSLGKDIERLRRLRQGRVLIAVDTAYHVLLRHGLVADIVFSVDPQALNQYYLEPLSEADAPQSLFVIDPTVSYLCLRHIPEDRLYYMESPFAMFRLLGDLLPEGAGEISYGGSVSTNAYDLALKLGCKRILLFGQDLAFSYGRAHAAGATLEDRLLQKESRFFRHEEHNYRQLSALPVRRLPGLDGRPVRTNDKLIIFHKWFEGRFHRDKKGAEIYDLKSAGARFASLDESAELSLLQPFDFIGKLCVFGKPLDEKTIDAFQKKLVELSQELAELGGLCEEGLGIAQFCYDSARNGELTKEYYKKLQALDKLDTEIRERKFSSEVAGSAMQRIIFSLTENFANKLTEEERRNPHLKSARESILLYEGLLETARDMTRALDKMWRKS